MDKRMQLLGKIGTILADFVGIVVMLMALAFAFARENPVLFVVIAAVVCPLWYKVVQKYWFREKPVVSALVRAVILIGGYLLLTQAIKWNPYNRCHDSVARKSFQERFEATKDEGDSFVEVGVIEKKEMWDYMKLTAPVSYKDESGMTENREIILYFDRLDGKIYKDFEALRDYRKQYREKYKANSFRDRQFFDDEGLDARIQEFNTCLTENQYDAVKKWMHAELRDKVTEEVWKGWQDTITALGAFDKLETPVEKNWSVTNDTSHTQTMEVKETLIFAEGTLHVRMVFNDDLTFQSLEISQT